MPAFVGVCPDEIGTDFFVIKERRNFIFCLELVVIFKLEEFLIKERIAKISPQTDLFVSLCFGFAKSKIRTLLPPHYLKVL